MLFPTPRCAVRCTSFLKSQVPSLDVGRIRLLNFVPHPEKAASQAGKVLPKVSAVIYPEEYWPVAKDFWQHSGEGISSRRAEFCQRALEDGSMV